MLRSVAVRTATVGWDICTHHLDRGLHAQELRMEMVDPRVSEFKT